MALTDSNLDATQVGAFELPLLPGSVELLVEIGFLQTHLAVPANPNDAFGVS